MSNRKYESDFVQAAMELLLLKHGLWATKTGTELTKEALEEVKLIMDAKAERSTALQRAIRNDHIMYDFLRTVTSDPCGVPLPVQFTSLPKDRQAAILEFMSDLNS